jgi:hypothetical protein
MNLTQPQLPPSHPSDGGPDLDARILAAEHAVLVRDQRMRHEAVVFGDLLRTRVHSSARIAAAAAIVPFLLGWLMARNKRRAQPVSDRPRHRHSLVDAPWAGLVPLVWPLLPERLRSRVSPGLASFLTGIGLPLIARHTAKRAEQKAAAAQAPSGSSAGPTLH